MSPSRPFGFAGRIPGIIPVVTPELAPRLVTELRLSPDESAPSLARAAIRSGLGDAVSPDDLLDVLVVASELVSNSVLHGHSAPDEAIEVRVWAGPCIRVEVRDDGRGIDDAAMAVDTPSRPGGRGLGIVAAISERWGIEPGRGLLVWAEICADRPAA